MSQSNISIPAYEAFSTAQGQFKPAIKDASNPFFKSRYADLASIWEAVGKALSDNGLSVTQPIRTTETGAFIIETIVRYKDGSVVESCTCPVIVKTQNDAQALGSAITYARRYSLASILCIVTDDDDAEAAVDRSSQQKTQQTNNRQAYDRSQPNRTPAQQKVDAIAQPVEQPTTKDPAKMTKKQTADAMKSMQEPDPEGASVFDRIDEFGSNIEKAEDDASFDWNEQMISEDTILPINEKAALLKKSIEVRINRATKIDEIKYVAKRIFGWKTALGEENLSSLKQVLIDQAGANGIDFVEGKFVVSHSEPTNEELSQALVDNG